MTVPSDPATALELERLRGVVGEGFAEVKGGIALLVQRSDQVERAISEHRTELGDLNKRLAELEHAHEADVALGQEDRLRRLEAGRWPLPTIGALTGLAALIIPLLVR
ncbi:hypothetical protein ACFVHB_38490 [Kitasatospora sp. NPDC127111]|uniref:hypothetical protein n=1 Tax=Kitasatospora sp. NPDC127111 TaxID=3345363 RepID=UPI00362A860D